MKWQIGLNPFEFRAGLKQHYSVARAFSGLNPFEFRAGLKPAQTRGLFRLQVLIPLNSGLA